MSDTNNMFSFLLGGAQQAYDKLLLDNLYEAFKAKDLKKAEELILQGAEINDLYIFDTYVSDDKDYVPFICVIILRCDIDAVKLLLKHKVRLDVNAHIGLSVLDFINVAIENGEEAFGKNKDQQPAEFKKLYAIKELIQNEIKRRSKL